MFNIYFPHQQHNQHNHPYVAIFFCPSHKVFIIPPWTTKHSQAAAAGQVSMLPMLNRQAIPARFVMLPIIVEKYYRHPPPPSPSPLKPAAEPSKSTTNNRISTPTPSANEKLHFNNIDNVPDFWNVSGCLCNTHSGDN